MPEAWQGSATMRQVWITGSGAPEMLQVREAAEPSAGAGEVRVRVAYAGVNFADIQARMGQYPDAPKPPCVVGYEVSGVIDQVGSGVIGLAAGDRVMALTRFGGYSEVLAVNAEWVHKLPDSVGLEVAGAIAVNYGTAWVMLTRQACVRPGQTVLIQSAGGGVGLAALQICLWRGATPIGTASTGKHERLKAMGCGHCIDDRSQDVETEVRRLTAGRGVDIALDSQGGSSIRVNYRLLAPLGHLVVFGFADSVTGKRMNPLSLIKGLVTTPFFHPLALLNANRSICGLNMGRLFPEYGRMRGEIGQIVRLVADGTLTPVVDKVFPFEQAAAAHQYIQDRQNFGKVLLKP
jgi:NADPH:quinone reductase-like Zn-dependent oxidoreductase